MAYTSKAVVTKITASSRMSIKIQDTFYTLEYSEERCIPEDADIAQERKLLWDAVNGEVDSQVDEIYKLYKKK